MFDLRLYVAGQSPRSVRALENLRRVCDEHLAGRYNVEVIDLLESTRPWRAGDEIIAVPTLVRKLPEPIRKIIGDLSDTDRCWSGCSCEPQGDSRREGAARRGPPTWMLTLYVSGASPRSTEAIETVRRICDEDLAGQVDLTVLNAADHPDRVLGDHILAIPTLVKHSPPPHAAPGRQPHRPGACPHRTRPGSAHRPRTPPLPTGGGPA